MPESLADVEAKIDKLDAKNVALKEKVTALNEQRDALAEERRGLIQKAGAMRNLSPDQLAALGNVKVEPAAAELRAEEE